MTKLLRQKLRFQFPTNNNTFQSRINAIAYHHSYIYVTGFLNTDDDDFTNPGTFELGNGVTVTTQNGRQQVFVAKFNHQLVAQNARVITTNGARNSVGNAIAVNNHGVYITGNLRHDPNGDQSGGTIDFGNSVRVTTQAEQAQIFVAKFNHQLVAQNARLITTSESSQGEGIAVNNHGVYITGCLRHDPNGDQSGGTIDFGNHVRVTTQTEHAHVFVAKFNHHLVSQNARVITTDDTSIGFGIAVNNHGVYIKGYIDNNGGVINFGNGHHARNFDIEDDMFIVKYNHHLETQAVDIIQNSGAETGTGIALSNNSVYVCGHDNNDTDGKLFKYSLCKHITQ